MRDSEPATWFDRYLPLETNLARKGIFWSARGYSVPNAIFGRDFLGIATAAPPLRLLDLEVFAWLSREAVRAQSRISFSAHSVALDLFGKEPGGGEHRLLAHSLERLSSARIAIEAYVPQRTSSDAKRKRWHGEGLVGIVETPWSRGRTVVLDPWFSNQLALGYVTFIDLEILRSLRSLAKRLWIYLEAEDYSISAPALTGLDEDDTFETTQVTLNESFATVLGTRARSPSALEVTVRRAFRRISAVDLRYTACEFRATRSGGIAMTVIRNWSERSYFDRAELFEEYQARGLLVGSKRRAKSRPGRQSYRGPRAPLGDTYEAEPYHVTRSLELRFFMGWPRMARQPRNDQLGNLRGQYAAYRQWTRHHTRGFVVVGTGESTPMRAVLHRSTCAVIKREPPVRRRFNSGWRICAPSLDDVLQWWSAEVELALGTCKRCSTTHLPITTGSPAFMGTSLHPEQTDLLAD